MALEEINNGGFIGDDSAESVYESFNKVKRNFESIDQSLIENTNVQSDLNQTDDTQPDFVKGVDQLKQENTSLGRMMSTGYVDERYRVGAFQNLSDVVFNSAIEEANIFDHISSPSYVAFRKSFHDNLGTPLPFVKGVKGVYRFSIQITNGNIFSFEIDTEKSNPFSESANNDFYIYESNILLINGNSGLFNDSNVSFVSAELLQASNNATIINSLDEISEAGSYLLKSTDNTPTNAYDINSGEQKLLSDFVTIEPFNPRLYDVVENDALDVFLPSKYLKVEVFGANQYNYDKLKDYRLNGVSLKASPTNLVSGRRLDVTQNGYTATYVYDSTVPVSPESPNSRFYHNVIISSGRDNFNIDDIPVSLATRNTPVGRGEKANLINIVTTDGFVRLYRDIEGVREWTTDWITYEEAYPRSADNLNAKIYTEKNILIGTYFKNRYVNEKGISIDNSIQLDTDYFLKSKVNNGFLIDGFFEDENGRETSQITTIKSIINGTDAVFKNDALVLEMTTNIDGEPYDFGGYNFSFVDAKVTAFTGQGIVSLPVVIGKNKEIGQNGSILYLSDLTGAISQGNIASSYLIEIQTIKDDSIIGVTPYTSSTNIFHVGKNALLVDSDVGDPNNDHNDFMTGIFNATHPNHEFNVFEIDTPTEEDAVTEAKNIGAKIIFRASNAQSLDANFFEPDIPYISAHFDNDDNRDDAIQNDNIDFYENAILVRGGVLGEDTTTATSEVEVEEQKSPEEQLQDQYNNVTTYTLVNFPNPTLWTVHRIYFNPLGLGSKR